MPQSYRILVVDDSETSLQLTRIQLEEAGFVVFTAVSGEAALLFMAERGLPHLSIVDVNMPDMDGFEFCHRLHQFCDVPVVMLTVVDDEAVVVRAIEEYAEDYLIKPVRPGEFVARVRRVLNRIGQFAYPLDTFTQVDEHLAVNFAQCQIRRDDQLVTLTPTEMKLLYILMRSAGKLVTTSFIVRRLWPAEPHKVHDDRLRVYIHRLRTKIEADPSAPGYISAQRRRGYVFASPANGRS